MPEELTAGVFRSLIEQAFRLRHDELPESEATLLEVEELSTRPGPSGRIPFSLLFAGDAGAEPVQATFELEHDRIGPLRVFLVPVGRDERGLLLEAVFN